MIRRSLILIVFLFFMFSLPMVSAGDFGIFIEGSNSDTTAPQDSTANSSPANQSAESSTIASAVLVGAALVVGSTILTVHTLKVKKEKVLGLQDQIYLAEGKDYRSILNYFALDDKDLIKANDELVAAGYKITSDQDAADYLTALMMKLAERSEKIQNQLSLF